jgi:hypothetical protein
MEKLETFILVAGSLAIACAFGWTATCKLMLLVASGSKNINPRGRPAISSMRDPLPAGAAVVIDLHEWKYGAAARVRFGNRLQPVSVHTRSRVARRDAARVSSGGPNKTHR